MLSSDPDISFFRLPRTFDRKSIERFAAGLQARVIPKRTFGCLITTDKEVRRLNQEFRRKDYPTDVLSFETSFVADIPDVDRHLGDLAISWQRARQQAQEFGHSPETEIQVLMLHGVLHLTGLDHESDNGRMSRTEKRWRKALGLPFGLIERVGA